MALQKMDPSRSVHCTSYNYYDHHMGAGTILEQWHYPVSAHHQCDRAKLFCTLCFGLELFERNRHDEAVRQLTKALQLNGNFTPALDVLGSIRFYRGEIDEAIKIYEIISDIQPNNKQAHLTLTKLLDLREKGNVK
jgi:tetratricopeptide (TPR) repeat protein